MLSEIEFTRVTPENINSSDNKTIISPFRYPGGKSWLRPWIRKWLRKSVGHLVEAFAGGANVTLTALSEGLAKRATLIELDPDVAAVWKSILNGKADWLADKIEAFNPTRKNVLAELDRSEEDTYLPPSTIAMSSVVLF